MNSCTATDYPTASSHTWVPTSTITSSGNTARTAGSTSEYVLVAHPRANGQVECANWMVLDALKNQLHDAANTKGGK
jgi:hypothetical protein